MSTIKPLLENLTYEVQNKVKPALSNFLTGGIVRNYLPQAWIFETESEILTFHVDKQGNAKILKGANRQPDVTVKGPHSDISTILSVRQVPPGADRRINILHHTQKGRTAWNYLGKHFGF